MLPKTVADTKATIQVEYGNIVRLTDVHGVDWQRDHICKPIFDPIAAAYPRYEGYLDEANLGLGCGFPVELAQVSAGETVLDLGCGAGVDAFIARAAVGLTGRVVGFDLTPELVRRASQIAEKQGFINIEFHCADIEQLPMPDNSADVVISNGVFSLLSSRKQVFQDMYRVLRPGGRFCICDLVRQEDIPMSILAQVLQYTGCLNGIHPAQEYLEAIQTAGFDQAQLLSERSVAIPLADGSDYRGLYAIAFSANKP